MATVDVEDFEDAVLMVSEPGTSARAWVCRATGKVYVRSELVDAALAPVPQDIDDPERYVPVPDVRTLGLGLQLVFDFAKAAMPDDYEAVQQMFKRPGAYAAFSDLVDERGLDDRWHAFREAQTRAVMAGWCEENGLQLAS
jgi:hypothetical protein